MSSNDNWTEIAMNMKFKVIGAALATLVMSGCASMSSDECMTADWTAIGYEDG